MKNEDAKGTLEETFHSPVLRFSESNLTLILKILFKAEFSGYLHNFQALCHISSGVIAKI